MPRQRDKNKVDGFTRRILLFLCSPGGYIMILPIKSTLIDRKIAVFGFSAVCFWGIQEQLPNFGLGSMVLKKSAMSGAGLPARVF